MTQEELETAAPDFEAREEFDELEHFECDFIIRNGHLLSCFYSYNYNSTMILIPDGVAYIDCKVNQKTEWGGDDETTDVILPEGLKEICSYAFKKFSALTSIEIPDSVTKIGTGAFSGCKALTSVTLPESLTEINDNTFYQCESLESIDIPASVESIGTEAFYECTALKEVTFHEGRLKTIADDAFYALDALDSVVLPEGLEEIGRYNFQYDNRDTAIDITFPKSLYKVDPWVLRRENPWYDCFSDGDPIYIGAAS